MASSKPPLAEADVFEDLSGSTNAQSANPYDSLVNDCQNDIDLIRARYHTHRTTRNHQQKAKLLCADFCGFSIDPVLHKLVNKSQYPDYEDIRNCLVFWARPPKHLKDLIQSIQERLIDEAPNLWLMPPSNLHMTTLEITHSRTAPEIQSLLQSLSPSIPAMTSYTTTHRACLTHPMLSYDTSAIALSFLPGPPSTSSSTNQAQDENYSYHHLRRDIYSLCKETGVEIASRYTVPSAHLTIGRFVSQDDILRKSVPGDEEPEAVGRRIDVEKVARLVGRIDEINRWLEQEFWPRERMDRNEEGEWVVGQEKGLDCRWGTLWYGGGETVRLGEGF